MKQKRKIIAEKFRPLADRILVEIISEDEKKSSTGIIIPTTAAERPNTGIVLALGPDCSKDVSVGNTVWFSQYDGDDFAIDGVKVKVFKESEIQAIING